MRQIPICIGRRLLWLTALLSASAIQAADVDLSCMSYTVNGKPQVTNRYKEYDVVLRNQCPGAVYWNLCIERLDPWTNEIMESLNPSGRLEAGGRSRVNLHIKPGPPEMQFRKRFQEFYVSADYAIEPPVQAQCVARSCEASRGELRRQIRQNTERWKDAEKNLADALAAECPRTGWSESEEGCEQQVREAHQAQFDVLAQKEEELRAKLAEAGSAGCTVHAGELVPTKN